MGFIFWVLLCSVIFLPTLGCILASSCYRYLGVFSLLVWVGLFLGAVREYLYGRRHDDGQL